LHRNGQEVFAQGRFFGDLMVEEAATFLRANKARPLFLYFALNQPHYPYQGGEKWLKRCAALPYPRNLYAAFLSTTDERIGRLLAELDALGLRDQTIVVFQSDNGHSTEERAHFGGGTAGEYRGAKFSLFEGGIRVPAMISWPGKLPQGEVRRQIGHGCDWLPTLAELCGVPILNRDIDGKSLVPVIRAPDAPSPHKVLHWQTGKSWAVRDGDWKLLGEPKDTGQTPSSERLDRLFLVNLCDDVRERANVANKHPDIVERLRKLHQEWETAVSAGGK
jgi:arylsulfatase A-like enzyme